METAFKKRSSPNSSGQNGKNKQQEQKAGKETGKDKAWWEQLLGTIPDDKEEQRKWYKLLANPLAVIVGLIMLGYWWFDQKQKHYIRIEQENVELKTEISRLKKKCKKLKKRKHTNTGYGEKSKRFAVLD